MEQPLLTELWTPIICFIGALAIRAVFAFIETSITAMRLFKIKELSQATGSKYNFLFQALEKTPHRVLITTLIMSSIADVTSAALATGIMETIFARFNLSSGLGFSAGIAFASIAIIIFGEIIPKNLAKGHGRGERIFKNMLWLLALMYRLLSPLVTTLLNFSNAIVYQLSGKQAFTGSEWISSEQEVQFLIRYTHEKGLIEPEKTEMLENIFELGYTPVKEIMVPATDIVSISIDASINNARDIFSTYRYTRLPVYEDKPENIVGMLHQKDLFEMLYKHEVKSIAELMRPIIFIPETVKINQLLRELRQKHMHIAIVINEHGSMTGLITLEDILEEIVGEISDEHELISEKIIALQEGGWLVDASIPLEDVEELLNISLESEESVTLGGFLTEHLQHLPKKGERLLYKHFYFQIQKASPKRVRQVLIFAENNKE
ncbi:MAG TPA: hemolysin family protein [Candidatus Dependentiae bacterium]|nr:hemolysin family protein [Candidatus Dependentiae bacterium]HRQ62804.1 hemolysin family protein [Candidatus Dependentiae bacterium]